MVSKVFYVHPYLGKMIQFDEIWRMGKKGSRRWCFFFGFGGVATVIGDERWEEMLYFCVGHRHQSIKNALTLCRHVGELKNSCQVWFINIGFFKCGLRRSFIFLGRCIGSSFIECLDLTSMPSHAHRTNIRWWFFLVQVWKSHCLLSSEFKLTITHLGWGLMPLGDLVLALQYFFFYNLQCLAGCDQDMYIFKYTHVYEDHPHIMSHKIYILCAFFLMIGTLSRLLDQILSFDRSLKPFFHNG